MTESIDAATDGTIGLYIRWDDGALVVAITGDLDMTTADVLGDALACLLQEAPLLIVDLRDVAFVDTSGLTPIVDAALSAEQDGKAVRVINAPSGVRTIGRVFPQVAEAIGLRPQEVVSP